MFDGHGLTFGHCMVLWRYSNSLDMHGCIAYVSSLYIAYVCSANTAAQNHILFSIHVKFVVSIFLQFCHFLLPLPLPYTPPLIVLVCNE